MNTQNTAQRERLTLSYLHSYHLLYDLIANYIQHELNLEAVQLLRAESLDSLLSAIGQHTVDVILIHSSDLLDGNFQNAEIRKVLSLLAKDKNVRTVFIAENMKSLALKKIMALGINAIVSTRDTPQELRAALAGMQPENECYVSQTIREELKNSCGSLTEKEWEVVNLINQGYSLTEIASKKFRAMSTVSTQKRNAMNKLHLKNEGELLRFLHQNTLF